MNRINVAIAGVGSLAKALVEGVSFYTLHPKEERGLMHPAIGPYRVRDICFVAAFDVDRRKTDKTLQEAIGVGANVTRTIAKPLEYPAMVHRGPTLDGIIAPMKGTFIHESDEPAADVAEILAKTGADLVINLIPSGSDRATYAYAEAALRAGCGFVNGIPTPLATLTEWRERFIKKGLVLLGDDIKSQLGATMLNRLLLESLTMRGIHITQSEQHNRGGNADHFNLLHRSASKERTKGGALRGLLKQPIRPVVTFAYTGKPSGRKTVHLKVEGELFGRAPLSISAVIEDEISINGAGTAVDAIRIAKWLKDKGRQKEADQVCPFLMKAPPKPMPDSEAFKAFRDVLRAEAKKR